MKEWQYRTPYFVIDEAQLAKDFTMLTDSLQKSWNNYRIGYSFKTNALPWLVTFLKERGVMAEVVSDDEYALASYLGFSDSEVVYNGPVKERDSFEKVLLAGGIINMDGRRELDWLEEIAAANPDRTFPIGIRVNFNLEKLCPGQTTMGEAGGRFGFSYENGVFAKVVERVRRIPNVKIAGLHLHSSSKTRSVAVFEAIAGMACQLKREFDFTLSYVDLGGGYCGGLPGRPEYPDYFPAVAKVLLQEFSPEQTALIVEPGISLLSKSTTFTTGVVDVRDIGEERYLITDGSRFNIDPTMIKSSHLFHLDLNPALDGERKTLPHQCVSGFSCMEVDRLFEYENGPELLEGDRIVYENVGGYTMALNPLFIKYFPDVYIRRDGRLLKVRDRWTPKEYVQNGMYYGEEKNEYFDIELWHEEQAGTFFKETFSTLPGGGRVIVTDCSDWAPALYEADAFYLVPRMTEPGYLEHILDICRKEKVDAILPLFEDELDLLAENRTLFEQEKIRCIVSEKEAVALCRDKYRFYEHLLANGLPVLPTCENLEQFKQARAGKKMDFPVFVKPIRGCGSVGISKVEDSELLEVLYRHSEDGLLIQQFADGEEFGADIYVDLLSGKPAAIFTKKKVRMRAGETEKAVSVKDRELFELIEKTVSTLGLAGPIDMDIFRMDGKYYISEINPRFGGGYPHAYHCGVRFPKLIARNLAGQENEPAIGAYEAGVCMMKYSDEIVMKL